MNDIWLNLANKAASYTVFTRNKKYTDQEILKRLNDVLDKLRELGMLLEDSEKENELNSLYWKVSGNVQKVDDLYFNKAWRVQLKINGEPKEVYSPFLKEADLIEKSVYTN